MSSTRRWLLITAIVVTIAAGCYTARGLILPVLGTWLDIGERPQKADFIMILTGEENNRPYLAAALIRAGYARTALAPGGNISSGIRENIVPPAGEIIRDVLISQGVPDEDIIILPEAVESTFDEAQALADFLKDKTDARVLIVTTDCHSRRACWIFSQILGERGKICFVSAPIDKYQLATWWRNDRGFIDVVAEYVKLMYYIIRYGYEIYYLAGGAILAILVFVYRRKKVKKSTGVSSSVV